MDQSDRVQRNNDVIAATPLLMHSRMLVCFNSDELYKVVTSRKTKLKRQRYFLQVVSLHLQAWWRRNVCPCSPNFCYEVWILACVCLCLYHQSINVIETWELRPHGAPGENSRSASSAMRRELDPLKRVALNFVLRERWGKGTKGS